MNENKKNENKKNENIEESRNNLIQQFNSYLKSFEKYNIEKKNVEEKKQKLNLIKKKQSQQIYKTHMTFNQIIKDDPFFFS